MFAPTLTPPTEKATYLENDFVWVRDVSLQPGEELPLHAGGDRVIIALSEYVLQFEQGGETCREEMKKGTVHAHKAGTHKVVNVGGTQARFLVVARKGKPLPASARRDLNGQVAKGAHQVAVLFENDGMRVTEVLLQPGQSLPAHWEPNRVVYSCTDYAATCSVELGICAERVFKAGDVHWYYAGFFKLENIEQTPAHLLIVGLKR